MLSCMYNYKDKELLKIELLNKIPILGLQLICFYFSNFFRGLIFNVSGFQDYIKKNRMQPECELGESCYISEVILI